MNQLLKELGEDYPDRSIQFCETIIEILERNPILSKNIYFTSECTFLFCRYCYNENAHIPGEDHQKVKVWAGTLQVE